MKSTNRNQPDWSMAIIMLAFCACITVIAWSLLEYEAATIKYKLDHEKWLLENGHIKEPKFK